MTFDSADNQRNLKLKLNDDTELLMIYCPAGHFEMGSSDLDELADDIEKPKHDMKIEKGFWISESPITHRQYSCVVDRKQNIYESSIDSPASNLTWDESLNFCETMQETVANQLRHIFERNQPYYLSLPTETQWEYACRAETKTKWYFGDDVNRLGEHSWCAFPSSEKLPAVKMKQPNPWGLYDLYGMVYEWCLDDFVLYSKKTNEDNYANPETHVHRKVASKIVRGGCIYDSVQNCRSASRRLLITWNSENDSTGFRIVLNQI